MADINWGSVIGGGVSGLFGLAQTALNNKYARENADRDREQNYIYGEMAARNADARTRALYNDFYSPEAMLRQYKEAGLSPAMMYGGTPGQGGMSGAQSAGGAGMQTPFMPYSLLEAAQVANLFAQTNKIKAETKNISTDTDLKELEKIMGTMNLQQYQQEFAITNSTWTDKATGKETSLFEMANDYFSFDEFLNAVRDQETDPVIKQATTTEAGQKQLRSIYENASRFNRDIMVLSAETVSAKFQIDIVSKLEDKNFVELNADAAIAQLKQSVATNELTREQKDAWNNLIDRLGKKGSTMKDIVIVLGMILGNFASRSNIKVNTGDNFVTVNKSE